MAVLCLVLVAMLGVASAGFAYNPKDIDKKVAQGLEELSARGSVRWVWVSVSRRDSVP